jgi:hypothetical protein
MPEPIFMKLGMYIMAPEPISKAPFMNPSHQPVSICASPPIVARQRIGKHVPRQRIHATIEELLDASFSIRSVCRIKGEILVLHASHAAFPT